LQVTEQNFASCEHAGGKAAAEGLHLDADKLAGIGAEGNALAG
jgi:hypothetical protein